MGRMGLLGWGRYDNGRGLHAFERLVMSHPRDIVTWWACIASRRPSAGSLEHTSPHSFPRRCGPLEEGWMARICLLSGGRYDNARGLHASEHLRFSIYKTSFLMGMYSISVP